MSRSELDLKRHIQYLEVHCSKKRGAQELPIYYNI